MNYWNMVLWPYEPSYTQQPSLSDVSILEKTRKSKYDSSIKEEAILLVKKKGWTQKQVIEKMNINQQTMRNHDLRKSKKRIVKQNGVSLDIRNKALEMVRNGASCSAAARAVGVSAVSVLNWCNREAVNRPMKQKRQSRKYPDSLREEVIRRVNQGECKSDVAARLNIARSTVSEWCHQHETEKQKTNAIHQFQEGTDVTQISMEKGIPECMIQRWCKQAGVLRE